MNLRHPPASLLLQLEGAVAQDGAAELWMGHLVPSHTSQGASALMLVLHA